MDSNDSGRLRCYGYGKRKGLCMGYPASKKGMCSDCLYLKRIELEEERNLQHTEESESAKQWHVNPFDTVDERYVFFAQRYAITGQLLKSLKEAGLPIQNPEELLQRQEIQRLIAEFRAERQEKFKLTGDKVIAELVRIAFGNIADFIIVQRDGSPVIDCSLVGREELAAIASIEQEVYVTTVPGETHSVEDETTAPVMIPIKKTKIKFHDKIRALELLVKVLRLIPEEQLEKMTPDEKAALIRNAIFQMGERDNSRAPLMIEGGTD